MRYFNVSGPCIKASHYMVDPATRLKGVEKLIDKNQYFVIHAARQSGKTTYLQDLAARLNAAGTYYALYCSLESLQNISEFERGIPVVLDNLVLALQSASIPFVYDARYEQDKASRPAVLLTAFLSDAAKRLDKPLVILFDEVDCLSESTLISFLQQLRLGYNNRGMTPFVHSIALVGMRNIRDYKAQIRPDSESLGTASPFNIVTKALTLQNFTKEEIVELYNQHTAASSQKFEAGAIELIIRQTQGQPWLVNAVAREAIDEILNSDYTKPVTTAVTEQAIHNIILRRDTHIDSLLARLKEERVRRVIEPMMLGDFVSSSSDDFEYTRDLGLVILLANGKVTPANPIYAEVMVRALNSEPQEKFRQTDTVSQLPRYFQDGRINMNLMLGDFQQFWRKNSAIWSRMLHYQEAAPHLILQAFLQRVLNGGAVISREFAAGSGRADLCITYESIKYPIELKIRREEKTLSEGLKQLGGYMDTLSASAGWLVIFDQRADISWDEKIYLREEKAAGKTIAIVGL